MGRGLVTGKAAAGAAGLIFMSAVALAQDPSEPPGAGVIEHAAAGKSVQASIRAGTCEDPGDVSALLADLTPVHSEDAEAPSNAWLGPQSVQPVRVSTTELPQPLAEIAEGEPVIIVGDLDAPPVACGIVGGQLIDETSLAVGLLEVGDSQANGIALLSGLGAEATRVQVFLVIHGDRIDRSREDPDPDPSASPAPAGGGDDIEPDPDDIGPDPEGDIDPGEDIDVDVSERAS